MAIALELVVDSLFPEEKRRLEIVPIEKQQIEKDKTESKTSTLQETIKSSEEAVENKDEKNGDVLKIEYGFSEELLAGALYNSRLLEYSFSPVYHDTKTVYLANNDDEEKKPQGWIMDEQEAEMMTTEEVEEAVADVQFAAASGSYGDVDCRTRERLKFSALFDPSAFWLIEKLGRVTNDVDYSRTV